MSSSPAVAYLDLDALEDVAEILPDDALDSANFFARPVHKVGLYLSPHRKIQMKRRDDGHFGFSATFEGGLEWEGETRFERYPLRKYLSTAPYAPDENNPNATTSSISEYLRAVGLNPKGQDFSGLIKLLKESENMPVQVWVGITDKSTQNAQGIWENANLRTKDFLTGEDDQGNPVYAPEVEIDGVTYSAKPKVGNFNRI